MAEGSGRREGGRRREGDGRETGRKAESGQRKGRRMREMKTKMEREKCWQEGEKDLHNSSY